MSKDDPPTAKTPHAFMREALGVQSRLLEQRQTFVAAAVRADRESTESGSGYDCADVNRYFEARAARRAAPRPPLRQWRE